MHRQSILVFSFIFTTSSIAGNVNHLLTEETGFCKPNRWYALGPCQQCYCEKRTKLICNTFNEGDGTDINVGSQKLTMCKTNLKKDTDRLLSEVSGPKALRVSEKNSEQESGEPINSKEKVKTPKEAPPPAPAESESDSSGQSEGGNKIRMPLNYPNIGDSPKFAQESDSDDRADSEVSNESVVDARKYHASRKESETANPDKAYVINMKVKHDKTENDNVDMDVSFPTKLMDLFMNSKLLSGNRRASVSVNTFKDIVVAYVHV